MDLSRDARIRLAAFNWLDNQVALHGDVLSRSDLIGGFELDGRRLGLMSPQQGIFKPAAMDLPISVTSIPDGPYDDRFTDAGLLYAYRGTDPMHRDNVGLRLAMQRQVPLIYFHRVTPGQYLVERPVFIIGDDPRRLVFTVAFDDAQAALARTDVHEVADAAAPIRRAYITSTVRRRLHQVAFRERVLRAYQNRCAFCRLRHRELLDAAHIIEDRLGEGEPVVPNGISLCKLHHAAYDRMFVTVRPDYVIVVRRSILDETDGPMLLHGLKGINEQRIQLPGVLALRPDPVRLEQRYDAFRALDR